MFKKSKLKVNYGFFGSISVYFASRPKLTAILMASIIGFGMLSYTTLIRREGFPSVNLPIAIVQGAYFADDVTIVDEQVSKPLQLSVSALEDVESVTTTTSDNFMFLTANLNEGATNVTVENSIKSAIESTDLPKDAQVQVVNFDAAKLLGEYDMLLSVFSVDTIGTENLEKKASEIAPQLEELDAVESAQVESLFESGVNPFTGEEIVQQVSFNQVGRRGASGGEMEFFNAAVIGVKGLPGDQLDIFELSEEVNLKIVEINQADSEGVVVTISGDFTRAVAGQIDSLQNNVFTGLIAILIISTIIIGLRVSAIMAIFVVAVLSVTIGTLYILGLSLNVITLFALVLALGLFVDDATIISEAIDARKRRFKGYKNIIGRAVNSVGSASFAGSMTTILVFVPLLFISGILGEFIIAMPLTIIVALLTSLTLSLTLIPWLSRFTILTASSIAPKDKDSVWTLPAKAIKGTGKFLANGIRLLKTSRKVGLLSGSAMFMLSIVFFFGAFYFFSQLGFNIFPPSKDSDELTIDMEFPEGTNIETAQFIAFQVDKIATQSVGAELQEIDYGGEGLANASGATARLELSNFRERDTTSLQFIDQLEKDLVAANIEGATFTVGQINPGGPQSPIPFASQIFTEDSNVAMTAADDMEKFLSELTLTLNNGSEVEVIITDQSDSTSVFRKDGRRYVAVRAGYNSDQVSQLLQLTRDEVKEYYTPQKLQSLGLSGDIEKDLGFDFGFESENEESFQSLGPAAIISIVAMFVLLMVQFRSITKPLLIFLAIPFSLLGVAFGLYITNNPLSFFAMIGFIGLIGIVVNNTILLIDAASRYKRDGKDSVESISLALEERFRPLLTTTLTTVVALTPLAVSDPFWEPLAVTIIFGLISSTVLVVLSFPAYYIGFEAASSWTRKSFNKLVSNR